MARLFGGSGALAALVLVSALGLSLLAASILGGVAGVDSIARKSEEALLHNGLAERETELAIAAASVSQWDEAVAKLDNRFDPAWAKANIGVVLTQSSGFDVVGVLDRTGAPIFLTQQGRDIPPSQRRAFVAAAAPLLARVRAREQRRGRLRALVDHSHVIASAIQETAVTAIAGKPYVLVVSLVQPDFGTRLPVADTAPVVVSGAELDGRFLAVLAERYGLKDARLADGAASTPRDFAAVPVRDVAGRPLLSIAWRYHKPGTEFFNRTRVPVLIAIFLIVAIMALSFLALRRSYADLLCSRSALKEALTASQSASRAKSDFLSSISHEIRTPLNGVMGALHLLETERLSKNARLMLDTAKSSGAMVVALINDVLDFSKIEAGRLNLAPEPTDMVGLLEDLVRQFQAACDAKGVRLERMIDPDLSWAEIDPLRFRQCLFNLIGNAVKFTAVGVVTVTARRDADAVIVEVRDTGIGIPESVKASLFQRFQQGDGSMTRTFGGTGLGLAITRRLAEAMGGGVRFDSTLWEGSSFWLSVQAPKVRKPVRPEPLPPAPAAALEGLKVLVVDDNATNLLIASRILAQWGAVVVTAPSGSAAIACVGTESFDLVLMDIQMPEMDGVETTRRLRQDSALPAETPIVALTANALDEQRRAYLAAGMNGVISKPIMPVVMLTEILRLLQTAQDVEAQVHSVCG